MYRTNTPVIVFDSGGSGEDNILLIHDDSRAGEKGIRRKSCLRYIKTKEMSET